MTIKMTRVQPRASFASHVMRRISWSERGLRAFWHPVFDRVLGSTMQFRLRVLLTRLNELVGGRPVTGSCWLRVDRTARHRQFDVCFKVDSPFVDEESGVSAGRLEQFHESLATEDRIRAETAIVRDNGFFVTARLYDSTPVERFRWGCWWKPLHDVSGDLWRYWNFRNSDVFLVSDGLGSGQGASRASRVAAQTIERLGDRPVVDLMEALHNELDSTRGAVLFLGRLPVGTNRLEYCTVGNISARAVSVNRDKGLWSYNGTVGYRLPDLEPQSLPLEGYDRLVFHTDGVRSPHEDFYDRTFFENGPIMNAARIFSQYAIDEDDSLVSVLAV